MSSRKSALSRLAWLLAAPLALGASLLASPSASAQSMTQVTGWQMGTEPSYITMYEHVPPKLATNAPILVVIHYCGGNAQGILGEASGGGIITTADNLGVLIVAPQLNGRNCWDVATTPSLTHATGTTAGGDTKAIVDMVKYEIAHRAVNANRVYAIGSSSGAMMTEALLAVYPDVFKGGSEFAGVPAGCWSASYTESNQWSGPCAGGQVTKTAQAWGDAVRAMFPGYNGFRPRIQLWHGTADSTINFNNQTEAVKQWTNVMGLSGSGTMSNVTISSHAYVRTQWTNSCNQTVLDEWTETNGPHGTDANMNGQYSMPFFALDTAANVALATDPQAGCGTTTGTGGSSGTGGSGAGGTTGTGGSTGRGGTIGTGGSAGGTSGTGRGGTGGSAQGAGGSTQGAGGSTQGAGGSAQGAGGSTQGAGGSSNQGAGGSSNQGAGGSLITGTGGSDNSGAGGSDNSGAGGSDNSGAGGSSSVGVGGDNGTSGTGNNGQPMGPPPPGCSCEVASNAGAVNALVLAGIFGVVFGRRRRAKTKRSARDR